MHLSVYVSCSNRAWFNFGDEKEREKERGRIGMEGERESCEKLK